FDLGHRGADELQPLRARGQDVAQPPRDPRFDRARGRCARKIQDLSGAQHRAGGSTASLIDGHEFHGGVTRLGWREVPDSCTTGSRKTPSAGSRISAPSMFKTNMNASSTPMSAWNLIGERAQVATASASVMPVRTTTLPVNSKAL